MRGTYVQRPTKVRRVKIEVEDAEGKVSMAEFTPMEGSDDLTFGCAFNEHEYYPENIHQALTAILPARNMVAFQLEFIGNDGITVQVSK